MSVERALVLAKPDAVCIRQAPITAVETLLKSINGGKLLCFEHHVVPTELAEQHYEEHKGKGFFPKLLNFICNPNGVIVMVFEGVNAVKTIREVFGPTFVEKAIQVECLRGKFGSCGGINCFHSSDSAESGARETKLWVDYFKIELNEEKAKKAFDEYKAKYDGKYKCDVSKVRDIVKKIRADSGEYVNAMKELSDCDDFLIKQLLASIILN
uniref:nucleoside-diphosphate kinase n=1 Tax=Entamoeba histolytica TaxID=5759 RepID=A0A060N6N1_ENTHI|nr:nucleoside diphosphate kinase, putative [Entamoeba histolytica]